MSLLTGALKKIQGLDKDVNICTPQVLSKLKRLNVHCPKEGEPCNVMSGEGKSVERGRWPLLKIIR